MSPGARWPEIWVVQQQNDVGRTATDLCSQLKQTSVAMIGFHFSVTLQSDLCPDSRERAAEICVHLLSCHEVFQKDDGSRNQGDEV